MTQGKNKKLGRKGAKKKLIDPFSKKEWYDVKAPSVMFQKNDLGKTMVTRSAGMRNSADSLMGRVFEVSLGDLKSGGEEDAFRQFKFRVEQIQGKNCLANFCGMRLTTDKLRSLVRKWHTLIEASSEVRTTDGYSLRVFVIGFTKRRSNQTRKTTYAQTSQVRSIRQKMVAVIQREASGVELKDLVTKLTHETIGKEIEKVCSSIYPLQNVFVRKVKLLRAPKMDAARMNDLHGSAAEEIGKAVERPAEAAAPAAAEAKPAEAKEEKPAEKK
jgi:small subunit ribosomal protein S3Ae